MALLVGVLVVGSLGASHAAAQDRSLTRAEAAALARDAETSDAALRDLRAVTSIGGRRVDVRSALADVGEGTRRQARLGALARELGAAGPTSSTSSRRARADAHRVVTGRDYRAHELPKPFRGVLIWLRDRLAPVGRFLERLFRPVAKAIDAIPGGRFIVLVLLLAGAVAAIAWLTSRRSGARIRTVEAGGGLLVDPTLDPDDLRRRADEAEAAGDFDAAIHLRFTEGVVRLVRSGRIQLRTETTASRVADEVGGPHIREIVTTFEEVVYGGRAATAEDCARARAGWLEVLASKAAR